MNELEATRIKLRCLEMVEGTELNWWNVIRHKASYCFNPAQFAENPLSNYEFALGIVEGKPVWKGDRLYFSHNGFQETTPTAIAEINTFYNGCWSWNPPKLATVMVELLVEDAEYIASHVLIEAATACRKALGLPG